MVCLPHIRRVCTPLDRVGRGSRPRQLHPSHYGFLCPVETPEGPACGLIKAFSLGARVTLMPSHHQLRALREVLMQQVVNTTIEEGAFVFLNGEILGYCQNPGRTH